MHFMRLERLPVAQTGVGANSPCLAEASSEPFGQLVPVRTRRHDPTNRRRYYGAQFPTEARAP